MSFRPGNIVCLKSGGPTMTVEKDGQAKGTLLCVWFSGDELKRGVFWPETLEPPQKSVNYIPLSEEAFSDA